MSKENLEIKLYPNPTTDFIVLNFEKTIYENVQISIVNSLGQVIQNQTFKSINQQERIDLNNLPQGVYYCRVQTEKGNWVQAFVVR